MTQVPKSENSSKHWFVFLDNPRVLEGNEDVKLEANKPVKLIISCITHLYFKSIQYLNKT